MNPARFCLAVAAALGTVTTGAAACPLAPADGDTLAGEGVTLAWRLVDRPAIPLSEAFAIDVHVCPLDAELLRVDAVMPAHRHGMNYQPSIESVSAGRWRVRGLLWHMQGGWELRFETRQSGRIHLLRRAVELR